MIHHVAQPGVRRVAHDDDVRLAAALGDRRSTAQSSQRRIITPAQGAAGPLAQQCRDFDSANAGHRSEDHDVLSLKALSLVSIGLADRRAQRIKLGVGLPQFAS